MNQIIARHTGQPLERVSKDTDRDFILTAEQAVEYGAIDEIITSRKIRPELAVAAAGARNPPSTPRSWSRIGTSPSGRTLPCPFGRGTPPGEARKVAERSRRGRPPSGFTLRCPRGRFHNLRRCH